MSAIQLSFNLATSTKVKTVHLLGSWDGYKGQLPLSKDASRRGNWKGTFRFQGSTLQPGQRYWYYYIVDGYQVIHDPAKPSIREATTGRDLNVLDVPGSSAPARTATAAARASTSSSGSSSSSHRRNLPSLDIPKGRPLSTSQIKSPRPEKPYQTRHLYEHPTAEQLVSRFAAQRLTAADDSSSYDDDDSDDDIVSDSGSSDAVSSPPSSLLSRSGSNSPSSASTLSDISLPTTPVCTCQRYGITRKGERIKLDCGGSRCGYSDSSECSSESDEDRLPQSTRRQGLVIRR
jgi:hypothetical protein